MNICIVEYGVVHSNSAVPFRPHTTSEVTCPEMNNPNCNREIEAMKTNLLLDIAIAS